MRTGDVIGLRNQVETVIVESVGAGGAGEGGLVLEIALTGAGVEVRVGLG